MQAKIRRPVEPHDRSGRGGRPRADQAGEVDRRILDAASGLFLRLGFDATSCDRVAVEAKAGKASLYARYPSKESLFAAVVQDKVSRTLRPSGEISLTLPLHARLQAAGVALLVHVLQPEPIAFMRVVYATVYRMPELAKFTVLMGREGGTRAIASAILGRTVAPSDELGRAMAAGAKFLDLAFVPQQMRALLGEDATVLQAEAPEKVAEAINLLSRAGVLSCWE